LYPLRQTALAEYRRLPSHLHNSHNGHYRCRLISNYDGQFKGMTPLRKALAESRNTVAIWITEQIGIDSILRTARSLGVQTPLQPYASTALGASEVNLLELANAYRTMASGILAQPYVIRKIVGNSGEVAADNEHGGPQVSVADFALSLIVGSFDVGLREKDNCIASSQKERRQWKQTLRPYNTND
jgi:membrane peptidoglycan carboxypeptidase